MNKYAIVISISLIISILSFATGLSLILLDNTILPYQRNYIDLVSLSFIIGIMSLAIVGVFIILYYWLSDYQ